MTAWYLIPVSPIEASYSLLVWNLVLLGHHIYFDSLSITVTPWISSICDDQMISTLGEPIEPDALQGLQRKPGMHKARRFPRR